MRLPACRRWSRQQQESRSPRPDQGSRRASGFSGAGVRIEEENSRRTDRTGLRSRTEGGEAGRGSGRHANPDDARTGRDPDRYRQSGGWRCGLTADPQKHRGGELVFADFEQAERRLERIKKERAPDEVERAALQRVLAHLEQGSPLRTLELSRSGGEGTFAFLLPLPKAGTGSYQLCSRGSDPRGGAATKPRQSMRGGSKSSAWPRPSKPSYGNLTKPLAASCCAKPD